MTYDPATRQLSGLSASFAGGTRQAPATTYVQEDWFARDAMGRITRIASDVPNGGEGPTASQTAGQCFTYDGFNRLKWAWTVAGTGSVGVCGTTNPTGVEPPGVSGAWLSGFSPRVRGLVWERSGSARLRWGFIPPRRLFAPEARSHVRWPTPKTAGRPARKSRTEVPATGASAGVSVRFARERRTLTPRPCAGLLR